MNVFHVLPRVITNSSGPSHSTTKLCESLFNLGCDIELFLLRPTLLGEQAYPVQTFRSVPLPYGFRLGFSPKMKAALINQCAKAQIIHNHSLWMFPNIYPAYAKQRNNCKLVVSPRGTLSEWALKRSRFKKRVIWHLGQKKLFKMVDLFHATSENEYNQIRNFGYQNPVTVIPNGIDIPDYEKGVKKPIKRKLLFLSRIHETKGLDLLLDAWESVYETIADWELVIAGPIEGSYPLYIQNLVRQKNLTDVIFTGELKGSKKSNIFFESDLFVLPTRSENFGIAIAEALAHGLPVITTKGAPWRGLKDSGCGWWVDIGAAPLIEALKEAMAKTPVELAEMGAKGREWMKRDFSWDRIGRMMYRTYEWLLEGGVAPDWVIND